MHPVFLTKSLNRLNQNLRKDKLFDAHPIIETFSLRWVEALHTPTFADLLFDHGLGLGRIQTLGVGARAVYDRVTPIQLKRGF